MTRPRRRALRTSDVLLAAFAYALCWAVAVIVYSLIEAATWAPDDTTSALPTWIFALTGFVPVLVAAAAVFAVVALLVPARAATPWIVLGFAAAGIVAFILLTAVLTQAPTDLLALEWGLRQVVTLVLLPAAGGTVAGLVAWRRARWRDSLEVAPAVPTGAHVANR